MLFNSVDFLIFFPIVYLLYWYVFNKKLILQNVLILIASYIFYAWWDWRFLFLLMFSILLDFSTGILMHDSKSPKMKKIWFWLSVCINLGFLGVFKYYNFFIGSFAGLLANVGLHANEWLLNIILPVGISFYTFHGLSYVIDIYKNRIEPERNFVNYSVFVSFFPLLVAGPIERATHLLPQVKKARIFNSDQSVEGIKMILWGFFKKVVVADSIAPVVNEIFNNYSEHSGFTLFYGAFLFAIQIYGDFSGYTDIALGTAKLMGFELLTNFKFPYFSRDIAEFWRRWHISLSSWFRDYLYIPLGGSRNGKLKAIRNTFIIFLVSGLWHGANWTFLVWGGLHAALFIPLLITGVHKNNTNDVIGNNKLFPSIKEVILIVTTFLIIILTWIPFRAEDINSAYNFTSKIFTELNSGIEDSLVFGFDIGMIIFLFVVDYLLMKKFVLPKIFTYTLYVFLVIIICGSLSENKFSNEFIYFQF